MNQDLSLILHLLLLIFVTVVFCYNYIYLHAVKTTALRFESKPPKIIDLLLHLNLLTTAISLAIFLLTLIGFHLWPLYEKLRI